MDQGCVLWVNRVVVPYKLRSMLLLDLHESYMGIVRMQAMVRQYFWWPGLNEEIETLVKKCKDCHKNASMPAAVPKPIWNWPSGPWKRLHNDC